MKRRHFLQLSAGAAAGAVVDHASALPSSAGLISLRIAPVSVELAPNIVIHTTGYNGQSPGPILRIREDIPATVSITNATNTSERVHWHGLRTRALDGDAPVIAPGATETYQVAPTSLGTRWYNSHISSSADLVRATNSGQFGFLLVEPRSHSGDFDQEVFLAIHHWEPSFSLNASKRHEVTYRYASFNDKLLGSGEPIRVRIGERVLFRLLNASPTEDVLLHLPGHRFKVMALDGNPVPERAAVSVLSLAVGERIDAIVEMDSPGSWIFGSVDDAERTRGLGICVEYANQNGPARWHDPSAIDWSYARFSARDRSLPKPDQVLKALLERALEPSAGVNHWIVNGRSYPHIESVLSHPGRYRLHMMNATDRAYPVHLHSHNFELTRINQIPVSGIVKDTIRLERYSVMEADIIVRHPTPTLFHLRNS